jgi:putative transposase
VPFWRLYYHLVWGTNQRIPALEGAAVGELRRALWGIAKDMDIQIHALSVQPDHVHIAFSAPPRHSLADIARRFKGGSSHYVGEKFEGDWCGWQPEYGVVSFGRKALPRAVAYINNQQEHHRTGDLARFLEEGLDPASPEGTFTA